MYARCYLKQFLEEEAVTSLTADLASASLNEYLNWRFGKPVPVLAFADTDAAKFLFIAKKEARALNEQ